MTEREDEIRERLGSRNWSQTSKDIGWLLGEVDRLAIDRAMVLRLAREAKVTVHSRLRLADELTAALGDAPEGDGVASS